MLGMENIIEGVIVSAHKVKTEYGMFNLDCRHKHSKGEEISLLLKQSGEVGIKLKVEDVLFNRDQFEVKTRGGFVIYMKDAPRIGQIVRVKVKVECLA